MEQTLTPASILHQPPYLTPVDSAYRALAMLRHTGSETLPVVDDRGRLKGVVTLACLKPLLDTEAGNTEFTLVQPVSKWMRDPIGVGLSSMTVDELRKTFSESGETTLCILDERGYYLGCVSMADLLAPEPKPLCLAGAGGMATPWGVYLTNGTIMAGAGNAALATSGVIMGFLLTAAHYSVGISTWAIQRFAHWHLFTIWNSAQPVVTTSLTLQNMEWFALQGLALPLFLLFIRMLPLTGYHAAEHQAVHALERGEPLKVEILRRLPRVHPRCGTNMMAAAMVFAAVSQLLPVLHLGFDSADSALLGAVTALFTWRSLGAFLQSAITTRKPTDKQIEAGIKAAKELQDRYLNSYPTRPSLLRRLWCMAIPQTAIGIAVGLSGSLWLFNLLFHDVN